MLLETFKSYLPDEAWLRKHLKDREVFILGLDGSTPPGISYEEQVGGSTKTEGQRKANLSDLIEEFDRTYKHRIMKCNLTIRLCKEWLEQIELKDRKLFELAFMQEPTTLVDMANEAGYHRTWVKRRIDSAIEKLEYDEAISILFNAKK